MVDVIVAALAAGASAGLSGTASVAVKDSYQALKALIRRRFSGRQDAQALEADETYPGVWRARIGQELTDTGAIADEQILAVAHDLLALTGAIGGSAPRVDASHAKGVQVGDHNTQTNTFG
jgi:hypothetical protein